MNPAMRAEAVSLLEQLQHCKGTGDDLKAVCALGGKCERLGFRAGTHLVLKDVAKTFAHAPDKCSILLTFSLHLPALLPDLGIILVTERTEDLRSVLPYFLSLLGPCVPTDLPRIVLLSRLLERFPTIDSTVFQPVFSVSSVADWLSAKLADLQYCVAKQQGILPLLSFSTLESHLAVPGNTAHCQLLVDLLFLSRSPHCTPPLSSLFAASTVCDTLHKLSYNDEYLVDAGKLCIELGRREAIFELDPYSVFYHFCCLLSWSSETFFDVLIDSEADLLEFVVLFAKEALTSWKKWDRYVYVWHLYEQRKGEVDGFLREVCGQLKARRGLLHFNPRALINQLQRLLK